MKKEREGFKLVFIMALAIFSVIFVFAAPNAPTGLIINQNSTSAYDEGNFTINWTSGAGDPELNYSIYVFANNVLFLKANNDSNLGYSFNNWTEANYTFIVEATNVTGNVANSTSNISIYVDRTAPVIFLPLYSNATSKKNTDSLTLNISVSDASSGEIGSLCLIDVNGTTNQTLAVVNGWCNSSSIDLTGSADGNHTLKIYVNDTVGIFGLNNSYVVQVDTTLPIASASCSPSSVQKGSSVSCSCSGIDPTSGINSSLTGSGESVITTLTGEFDYTCSVTDNAGNSHSSTVSYIVEGNGNGGENKNRGTTLSYETPLKSFSGEGYTKTFAKNEKVEFEISSQKHTLQINDISEKGISITIFSEPQELSLEIGEEKLIELTGDNYYDLLIVLNSIENELANITIKEIGEDILVESEKGKNIFENLNQNENSINYFWIWIILIIIILFLSKKFFWKNKNLKNLFKKF